MRCVLVMETKICNKCNKEKLIDFFGIQLTSKDGIRHICKSCTNNQSKILYRKKSNTILKRQAIWREKNRDNVLNDRREKYKRNREEILLYQRNKWNDDYRFRNWGILQNFTNRGQCKKESIPLKLIQLKRIELLLKRALKSNKQHNDE